jgi:hypothetical protein
VIPGDDRNVDVDHITRATTINTTGSKPPTITHIRNARSSTIARTPILYVGYLTHGDWRWHVQFVPTEVFCSRIDRRMFT